MCCLFGSSEPSLATFFYKSLKCQSTGNMKILLKIVCRLLQKLLQFWHVCLQQVNKYKYQIANWICCCVANILVSLFSSNILPEIILLLYMKLCWFCFLLKSLHSCHVWVTQSGEGVITFSSVLCAPSLVNLHFLIQKFFGSWCVSWLDDINY